MPEDTQQGDDADGRAAGLVTFDGFVQAAHDMDTFAMESLIAAAIRVAVAEARTASLRVQLDALSDDERRALLAGVKPAPGWTREVPSVAGAYWMRCDERETQVVTLYIYRDYMDGEHLCFDMPPDNPCRVGDAFRFWRNVEWCGPLEVPQ